MDSQSRSRNVRDTIRAVGIAAITCATADVLVSALRGPAPAVSYLALGTGLTLAGAVLVTGIFASLLPRVAPALAGWIALNAFLALFDEGRARAATLGAVAGVVTWAALRLRGDRIPDAGRAGLSAAVATVFLVVVAPRLAFPVGARPEGFGWGLVSVAATAGLLAAHSGYAGWRSRPRWLPSDGLLSVGLLAALIALMVVPEPRFSRLPGELDSPPTARDAVDDERPTIIVLILDTVRADHLSVYGYERDTTPHLRRFLEASDRAVLYPLAFSPATWTYPAHASLFSGQLPSTHGAHGRTRFRKDYPIIDGPTLAEALRDRGYRTAAIFSNFILSLHPTLRRGFDVYLRPPAPRPLKLMGERIRGKLFPWVLGEWVQSAPPATSINRGVLDFLERCTAPCFVVANYMEAHEPYAPARPHAGLFTRDLEGRPRLASSGTFSDGANRMAAARYDEEIHALDAALGDLLHRLDRRGTLDRAWLVITSDHGEAFGEHDLFAHGTGVYNEEVRIPLLVQPPRGQRLEPRDDAVDLLDVTATLSAIAGGPRLGLGRDLRDTASERPVQIEFFAAPDWKDPREKGPRSIIPARAVVLGTTKLIEYPDTAELYRIAEDPEEQVDCSAEAAGEVARLEGLLPRLRVNLSEGDAEVERLSHEERERLRALGYLQ